MGFNTKTFRIAPISEMTYIVSSGTLNSSIPYHTFRIARVTLLHDAKPNGVAALKACK